MTGQEPGGLRRMLTAHLLGGFSLNDPNGRDVSPRSRKARGLLGYLMLSELGGERREKLAGLLWSESATDQAYDSLRHCLAELRKLEKATDVTFIDADRQSVRIDRGRVQCDVIDLKAHLAAGRIAECRQLLTLPDLTLMPGVEADDPTFDNWLMVERERNAEMLARDMLALLQRDSVETRDRLDLARAIQQLDPYQEDAVRIYVELLVAEGNVAGATAFFERYRSRLLREYEVDPSDELLDFVEELLARASAPRPKPAAKATAQKSEPAAKPVSAPVTAQPGMSGVPVIAVLSMSSAQSADPIQQLSDAFMHELVSTLCRFKEWTVTSPGALTEASLQSVPDATLDDLSARGVDFALIASVTAVAGTTVINVRLVECDGRAVVISDQYPASSENWLAALNDICCRVASRTKTSLIAARLRKSTGKSVEQLRAYDLWLEGEVLTDLWERETEEKAVELFSRAVELDPTLAGAYAGWASVLNSRWIMYPGLPTDAEDREQAYQLAKKAVALDPLNTQTQGNLGWCHILAGRFEPAELHIGLAYDLNPSNPDNLLSCALAHAFCGNHERARGLSRRAFELNPFPQPYYHGYRASIDFLGRDFAGCIEAVNRAPDLFPDIQAWAAASYGHLGDLAAGRTALDHFFTDLRKRWVGATMPSDDAVCAWFVSMFPIRYDADRKLLTDGIAIIRSNTRHKKSG